MLRFSYAKIVEYITDESSKANIVGTNAVIRETSYVVGTCDLCACRKLSGHVQTVGLVQSDIFEFALQDPLHHGRGVRVGAGSVFKHPFTSRPCPDVFRIQDLKGDGEPEAGLQGGNRMRRLRVAEGFGRSGVSLDRVPLTLRSGGVSIENASRSRTVLMMLVLASPPVQHVDDIAMSGPFSLRLEVDKRRASGMEYLGASAKHNTITLAFDKDLWSVLSSKLFSLVLRLHLLPDVMDELFHARCEQSHRPHFLVHLASRGTGLRALLVGVPEDMGASHADGAGVAEVIEHGRMGGQPRGPPPRSPPNRECSS